MVNILIGKAFGFGVSSQGTLRMTGLSFLAVLYTAANNEYPKKKNQNDHAHKLKCLVGWLVGSSVGLVGCLVRLWVVCLAWLVRWLAGWLGCLACLLYCLLAWLVFAWLPGWLLG